MDFYPTILELTGQEARPEQHLDGRSFMAWLRQPDAPADATRSLYWHFPHYGNQGGFPGAVLMRDGWKLVQPAGGAAAALYDLKTDPEERRDRAAEEPARVAGLSERLRGWWPPAAGRRVASAHPLEPQEAFLRDLPHHVTDLVGVRFEHDDAPPPPFQRRPGRPVGIHLHSVRHRPDIPWQ